jgi:adenylosuccinate lyase
MIGRYCLPKMLKIWSEENKFEKMLSLELLVCEAWHKLGRLPKKSLLAIKSRAKIDVAKIKEMEEKTKHDMVAFVNNLSESVGQEAKYIHMGLTSNDVLDTTLACQMAESFDLLIEDTERLLSALAKLAKKYKNTPCIGRTHGVHAEPMTFGLKVALWHEEIRRNLERLKTAKAGIAVGKLSGTIGTYSNIEPQVEVYVCEKLKLAVSKGSTQVIPRDRHAVCLATMAIVASSLEKFATEIRHLQKTEVSEVEEPFGKGQKGSSAMPHKRNPVVCERICGLARLLRSNAMAEMENISLWHERDISHSSVERVILPDSALLLDYILNQFIEVIEGLNVYPKNMLLNLGKTNGLVYSQRVLLELMKKGPGRPQAYDIIQKNAFEASNMNRDFKTVLLNDPKVKRYLSASEIEACFDIKYYLRHIPALFKSLELE